MKHISPPKLSLNYQNQTRDFHISPLHPFSTLIMAKNYLDHVYKLHGMPLVLCLTMT
jgi:hypothetical protein